MMITLKQMARELGKNDSYRIFFHKKPDGDAVGSAYALALGLRSIGCRCAISCSDPVPNQYHDLTAHIKDDDLPEGFKTIAVDCADPKRLGAYSDEKIDFCIDHHEKNGFADALQYIEEDSSSCAQIILKLLEEIGIAVTKEIADLLFTGLVTDTACFRSMSTDAASFRTAAKLAALGADVTGIARRLCLMKSPQRIKIEQILINSYHYTCDGKVLGSMFTYDEMMKAGIQDSELEGLNSIVEQVDGVDIGIVVREIKPGQCRVSIRTSAKYNAADLCAAFGGGGHPHAAGCNIAEKPQNVLKMVETVCGSTIHADTVPPAK